MNRTKVFAFALLASLVAFAAPAAAQEPDFTIVLEGVVTGNEGDVVELVSQPVDAALVGQTCSVAGATENNGSVHPGNDVLIATGGASATVAGTEDQPGQVVSGSGTVVLGDTINVSLRFGPDGVSSGGVTLTFTCEAAAPVGGVDTGAGGSAFGDGQSGLNLVNVVGLGAATLVGAGVLAGWKRRSATI